MNIAVAGLGYVGLSLAVLLAQHNRVVGVDVIQEKVDLVNDRRSPIADKEIEEYLASATLDLQATTDGKAAYKNSELIVIAAPTNYDTEQNCFDTSLVEQVIDLVLESNPKACMIIKSTVPVGYTHSLTEKYPQGNFLFSPEFLREGRALYDNLHPSRIIVGIPSQSANHDELQESAEKFIALLQEGAIDSDVPAIIMRTTEAEAVKLFSNTYLALRVAYFNELDTYASVRGLSTAEIIKGVSLDPRIGSHYNNPSFGYGGYCLPKDTKQLLANYKDIPQNLIRAIVDSNRTRKDYIANELIDKYYELQSDEEGEPVIGVYRLTMKTDSDNFRHSSIQGIIRRLNESDIPVLIYEPSYQGNRFYDNEVISSFIEFKQRASLVVSNRWDDSLAGLNVYTCDIFRRD